MYIPAPVLPKDAYTPWLARVAATIVDFIPVVVFLVLGQVGMDLADRCFSEWGPRDAAYCRSPWPMVVGPLLALTCLAVALGYAVWNWGYRQGTTGSSVGKSLLKFRVVSEKTWQPIGFGLSLVRQNVHWVDQLACYIGFLFPLWDAKRQTFADMIMTTVCVPITPKLGHPPTAN